MRSFDTSLYELYVFTSAMPASAGISCLSVRLLQVGVLKRLNVGSRKQCVIARGFSFSVAKYWFTAN